MGYITRLVTCFVDSELIRNVIYVLARSEEVVGKENILEAALQAMKRSPRVGGSRTAVWLSASAETDTRFVSQSGETDGSEAPAGSSRDISMESSPPASAHPGTSPAGPDSGVLGSSSGDGASSTRRTIEFINRSQPLELSGNRFTHPGDDT